VGLPFFSLTGMVIAVLSPGARTESHFGQGNQRLDGGFI
jgi:hypothetical protein